MPHVRGDVAVMRDNIFDDPEMQRLVTAIPELPPDARELTQKEWEEINQTLEDYLERVRSGLCP